MEHRSFKIKDISLAVYMLCVFLTGGIMMVSCQQDTEEERFGSAMLDPEITIDPAVKTSSGEMIQNPGIPVPSVSMMSFRLSNNDGAYARTWDSVDDYPRREPLRPGLYLMEAFYGTTESEGFDTPCFYGSASVNMLSGQNYTQSLACTLANAVTRVTYTPQCLAIFSDITATLHSEGGIYLDYPATESRLAFMQPADMEIYLNLTAPTGEQIRFSAATLQGVTATTLYDITIDAHNTTDGIAEISVATGSDVTVTRLTTEFLSAKAPELSVFGTAGSLPISLPEGDTPDNPLGFTVSGANATSLILTSRTPALTAKGWPASIDILNADAATLSAMESLGLKITRTGDRITGIDLTDAVRHLRSSRSVQTFSLIACAANGRTSQAQTIEISSEPVELSVIEISDVLMGVNIARMKILSHGGDFSENIGVELLSGDPAEWIPVEILSATADPSSPGEWNVTIKLPELRTPKARLRVNYLGQEKISTTVNVVSPTFTLHPDAFAKLAILQIHTDRPDLTELITSLVNIYVNGNQTQLVARYPEDGRLIVGGLEENTDYTITATLYDRTSADGHFTSPVTIHTERTSQLPDPSFEDVHTGLKYAGLPSGGRYSQNIVDIYNQQNYASYDYFLPKSWANVNAKTFCTAASNHNTWYMQPSAYTITDAMDGSYAVAIQTTAWDLSGQQIPDYRQTGQPYVSYSRNIPYIAQRSAGRLFLGRYAFNPANLTETYIEGIEFSSRPSALNGYYRFVPCTADMTDCGVVLVEVIGSVGGSDVVIARALHELVPASGYTAFSTPLSYTDFGVKAKGIRVMFASSRHYGSIETESQQIKTYSDPVTSTSLGGLLWIDNITLSY